jgi:glyoxylase-like metal-dependent hydrolase (beta-lactamase superfamily II)
MTIVRHMAAVGLALSLVGTAGLAPAQQATREITNIAGDLYRFQNNFHFSVFYVTDEGIVATDPINKEAAAWLKQELAARFDQPVKYLIYSHHHPDHVSGGEVFADTATFIAHENMPIALAAGGATGVRPPDIVFADRMTLTLGGKTVELHYVGKSHSDNIAVMRFPDERTVFTVDFITVKRLPFRTLGDSHLPDWIEAIRRVEQMDFDIVAPGPGALGTRQDVADYREYLEALTAAVQAQIDAGKTVAEAQAAITLDEYSDWGQYEDWLPENIAGAYRILSGGG